ncbi:uncharacterized protein O3C94_016790 [Discoglossus pictus]
MRSPREIKEEEIPVNISEGLDKYNLHIVTVKEEQDDEREDSDIHSHPYEGLQGENLNSELINEDGQYEKDEKNIQQLKIQSDPCIGSKRVKSSVLTKLYQEETNVRSHQKIKEEEIPIHVNKVIVGSKKAREPTRQKRKLVRTTIHQKKEIIAKYERGSRVSDLAAEFKMPRTTISTIVRNKEAIKGADVARGVKTITKQRSQTLEEVEKFLYVWINEKQLVGDRISKAIICEKAKQLHADLLKDKPATSGESTDVFKASHGWFENFRKRSGIQSLVRHGEAASADKEAAWRELWPEAVALRNLEAEPSPIVEDIVSLGNPTGLEMSNEDIKKLVEEHRQELSTEELQELQREQQQKVAEERSSGEEEGREEAPTALIKEMCSKWVELQNFVEKYHPDNSVASRVVDLFNDQTMSHFRNILKRRQKQLSLHRFLVKVPKSESPAEFSGVKRQRRERSTVQVPDVLLEEDSSSRQ